MKKALSAIVCLAMVLSLALSAFPAYAENEGGIHYSVIDGKVEIYGVLGVEGALTIPSTLGGYPVAIIDYDAFENSTGLTSITIPDSVTEIGDFAFRCCTSLAEISVAEGNENYKSVDGVLFNKDITKLIQYPAEKADTEYTVPAGVTSIVDYAFEGCTGLTSIVIPDSVTSIGDDAFSGCTGLAEISVAEGNGNYGSVDGVLYNKSITGLIQYPAGKKDTAYTVPAGVTSIGWDAFVGCTGLAEINVEEGNIYYRSVDGVLFGMGTIMLVQYPAGKTGTSYTIPDSVEEIVSNAFRSCTVLTSITIPGSVAEIGKGAFFGCSGLTSLTISNGVRKIGEGAFEGCSKLITVVIPASVQSIGKNAFLNCTGLSSVSIYNTKCDVADFAFWPTVCLCGYKGSRFTMYSEKFGNQFVVFGDLNLSGTITIADALMLFKHIAGVDSLAYLYGGASLMTADIDGKEGVTISDALTLFKFVAGVITELK